MKKLFFLGLIGLGIFEVLKVYFIMPMPGSQQWDSLSFAYFLHSYRWLFRFFFFALTIIGLKQTFSTLPIWIPTISILVVMAICFIFNFKMSAEGMFLEPKNLDFASVDSASLADSSLVIAVEHMGEAKAYPIRFIAYHHQVRDNLGGKEIMVTYCSVCRTGRVFEPLVNEQPEKFRLVGMDYFNAMFEDQTTGTWWQQANGEAIIGPLKGTSLPEMESTQLTLGKFFSLYPNGKVMKADPEYLHKYDSLGNYEFGLSKSKLTGTDSISWNEKSWVVGVKIKGMAKAYDWNDLVTEKIIHDQVGVIPIVIVLSRDQHSFKAFLRKENTYVTQILPEDLIVTSKDTLDFLGVNISTKEQSLVPLIAYQEFWHSWRTFNPTTEVYQKK